jgi:methylmalonyl-CoA mutase, N-terminal domain
VVTAIESGWIQQQIADAAYEQQRQVEGGGRVVVGVNRFQEEAQHSVQIHRHLDEAATEQNAALSALRAERDGPRVSRALGDLRDAALSDVSLMPTLIEAVRVYATIGEICGVLREAFGEYKAVEAY